MRVERVTDGLTWLINLHDFRDHRLKDGGVACIIHSVLERKIDGIVLSEASTDVLDVASPREVLAELVERDGEDSVRSVESFLDAIAVVNIDVDVQHCREGWVGDVPQERGEQINLVSSSCV